MPRPTIVSLALALSACAFSFDRPLKPGEIHGRLLVQTAGAGETVAAAGATVYLLGTTRATRCDGEGRFLFSGLPAGVYALRATHDRDGDGERDAELRIAGLTIEARASGVGGRDIGTQLMGAVSILTGTVTRNGAPASRAVVSVDGFPAAAVDPATGKYRLAVYDGEWSPAVVYAPGGPVRFQRKVRVPVRGEVVVDFELTDADPTEGAVRGRVLRGGKVSHEGTRVVLSTVAGPVDSVETGEDGTFALAAVPAGVYTLTAEANGFVTAWFATFAAGGDPLPTLTLLLEPGSADCDGDGEADAHDADDDEDGVSDAEEAAACRCAPGGSDDADANGVCDDLDAPNLANAAPVASAGEDQQVNKGATVTLDASASSDADGDALTFAWTAPQGITLSDASAEAPTFTAPATSGALPFTLVVSDGEASSAPDTVTVTVTNRAPVADAGAAQSANKGDTVTLDGSASSDPDGDALTFAWTAPQDVTLSDASAEMPTFTATGPSGEKVFSLVVNDGETGSAPATVAVTVTNRAPVAGAGADAGAAPGQLVTLDGTGSSDPDAGDTLTYAWTQTAGTQVALSSAAAASPTFSAPLAAGTLTFSLTVSDGEAASAPDTVTITVVPFTGGAPVEVTGHPFTFKYNPSASSAFGGNSWSSGRSATTPTATTACACWTSAIRSTSRRRPASTPPAAPRRSSSPEATPSWPMGRAGW
jgi:hypothetical protein